jgi:parallel beta-helix repeat protein
MIAAISIRNGAATMPAPTGWTVIRKVAAPASSVPYSQSTYRRTAGGSEPANYVWTFGATVASAGGIVSYSGVNTTPVNVENGQITALSSTHSTPSVTTTVANTMLVTSHSPWEGGSWTPPTGMTERVDVTSASFPGGTCIEISDVLQSASGATGAKTATVAPTGEEGAAQIVALAPAPVTYSISGTVFEDQNYGGGAGRSLASSSGIVVPSARVELFTGANYTTFATTDGSGNYSFSGLAAATYTVRVVNGSVNSSRTGTEVTPPVQTFRTNGSSGAAVAVTDHVGGEVPASVDAGNGSGTLAALTAGAVTPQSITSVVLGANITGVDFGYSYNVIVNKNNTGQGSLRQFLLNANALSNTGLAQSGLTSGIDNAVFMLADGTARSGLQAAYATQFASSIASITLTTALPTISDPVVIDARLQPGHGTVPMIELNGTSVAAPGLTITAGSSTVSGLIINRFTGATGDGIYISTAGSNTITANYIGTNAAGTAASANAGNGINILTGSNIVGGLTSTDRNVVSGNTLTGIFLKGAGNTVEGNYIGTNAAGAADFGNSHNGIELDTGGTGNTIGGTATGAGNVISGNDWSGLSFNNSATGNFVYGNYIGTNATGASAIANTDHGVYSTAINNTIGGTTTAARNIISGNTKNGIYLTGGVSGNIVQGNYIGLNASTASLPNVLNGVNIDSSSSSNTVGGTAAGAGNVISANTLIGVTIAAGCTGNTIRSNSIYGNTGIGIELVSVAAANNGTKNGANANSDMDSPVFTSVTLVGTTLTLAGYVGSASSQSTFAGATVEVFKSDNDASGYGEGQTYLGTLTADGSGNLSGTITTAAVAVGDKITGTATDGSNNTSEFGANFTVTVAPKTWDGGASTNNWGDAANWNADGVPIATDNVDLTGANTININVAAVANNLLLNNAGLTLTINSGSSLAMSGALTLTAGTLNMGTNTISGAGSFTVGSGGNLGIGSTAGITSSGATGNVQVSGSRSFSAAANYTYNGSSAQVTGNGLPATVNNLTVNNSAGVTLTATVAVSSDLTITAGTLDLSSFTVNRASSGGTLTVSNGATLKIGGTNGFPTNYSTNTLGATSTVDYSGTAQAVGSQNYGHLTLSNSGAKTFAAGTEGIAGTFTISGTATAAMTTNTPTVDYNGSGAQTILGQTYYNLTASNAGTKTLAANAIVNNNLTVSSTAILDLSSFTADRASSGGTLSVASGATLKIGGTNTLPANYSTHAIGSTSTIEYSGTTQSVAVLNSAQNYGHLTISGSGTKTLAGTNNVAGNLTISAGTFDLGSFTANRASAGGTLTLSNGATLKIGGTNTLPSNFSTHSIGATSTIEYSGTTQSVAVLNSTQNYGHLTISGSGTKTLAGTNNVAGDLTISAGTFDLGSFTANRASAGGTLTVSNSAGLKIGGTNGFPTNYSTNSLGATSTVDYSGTAQAVGAQNYGHLTLSTSGAKTFATGTIGIAGTFTISGTATANMTTNSPTVDYNGSGAQSILGQTYYNLTVSNTGTKTLAATAIVNNNLTTANTVTLDLGSFAADRASAGGTLSLASGTTLKIGGTNTLPANYTTHSIGSTSTVEYSGSNQALAALNSSQDYGHLTISGSGTKTSQPEPALSIWQPPEPSRARVVT